MEPINFKEANLTLAKNQPQYKQLPVYYDPHNSGVMIYCYKVSWLERLRILFSGKIWASQLTYNNGFNPVNMAADKDHFFYRNQQEAEEGWRKHRANQLPKN